MKEKKLKIKALRRLVRKKDSAAMLELAEIYGGVKTGRGRRLYKKAAMLGETEAERILALHFYTIGLSVVKNNLSNMTEYAYEIYVALSSAKPYVESLCKKGEEEFLIIQKNIERIIWEII